MKIIKRTDYEKWHLKHKGYDWANHYKIKHSVEAYLFRYVNYEKGLINRFIIKSTFGRKNDFEIQKEINWWFDRCIGAYNKIKTQ